VNGEWFEIDFSRGNAVMNKTTFETTIYYNWASHLGCQVESFSQPGPTLLPAEKLRGEAALTLWKVGQHSFLEFDPELAELISDTLANFPTEKSLTAEDLVTRFGEKRIAEREQGFSRYLFPEELPASALSAPYSVRPLTLTEAGALLALKGFLTSAEVEEGYVEIEHLVAFGCFSGAQLVAASSGYEMDGFLDLGVLTHSGHRRQGLGKAVVGALCVWAHEHGFLAQYRHAAENHGSARLAESLHFKVYAEEDTFWLK
jgi:GNAT superfamily N-acetyltransferase